MSFGERLSQVLEEKGLTRADLCRMTGLTSGHLTPYIKNPDRSPTLSTACKIALALDVTLDYLGGMTDEPRPIKRDENGRIVMPEYTDEELEILDAYRASNAQGKASIAAVASAQPGMEEEFQADRRAM